jgi:hypothetical protein
MEEMTWTRVQLAFDAPYLAPLTAADLARVVGADTESEVDAAVAFWAATFEFIRGRLQPSLGRRYPGIDADELAGELRQEIHRVRVCIEDDLAIARWAWSRGTGSGGPAPPWEQVVHSVLVSRGIFMPAGTPRRTLLFPVVPLELLQAARGSLAEREPGSSQVCDLLRRLLVLASRLTEFVEQEGASSLAATLWGERSLEQARLLLAAAWSLVDEMRGAHGPPASGDTDAEAVGAPASWEQFDASLAALRRAVVSVPPIGRSGAGSDSDGRASVPALGGICKALAGCLDAIEKTELQARLQEVLRSGSVSGFESFMMYFLNIHGVAGRMAKFALRKILCGKLPVEKRVFMVFDAVLKAMPTLRERLERGPVADQEGTRSQDSIPGAMVVHLAEQVQLLVDAVAGNRSSDSNETRRRGNDRPVEQLQRAAERGLEQLAVGGKAKTAMVRRLLDDPHVEQALEQLAALYGVGAGGLGEEMSSSEVGGEEDD